MKLSNVNIAVQEAKRFLEKASNFNVDLQVSAKRAGMLPEEYCNQSYHSKSAAALKRSSLDLTCALAEMRNEN